MKGAILAALALAGVVSVTAAAEREVSGGHIVKMRGLVTVQREGKTEAARKGYTLQAGDTIKTGSDGVAQWWMEDDSLYLLPTGSTLHIDEYTVPQSNAPASGKSFFSLIKGAMRSITGLIAKGNPQNYRVATPVATMGVRGTDFALVLCANDCVMSTNTMHKSSLRGLAPLTPRGIPHLVRTASAYEGFPANGLYLKMKKMTGELCNAGGCQAATAGEGSGCAFAVDSATKPVLLPTCPHVFDRFDDDLDFDFDEIDQNRFRQQLEKPASPS